MSGHPALLPFLSALLQTGKSRMAPALQDQIRRGSDRYSERVVFRFHLPESPCWSAHLPRRVPADRQDATAPELHLVLSVRLSGPGRARRGAGCRRCNSSPSESSRGGCYQRARAGARQNTFVARRHASAARVPVRVAQSRGALLGNRRTRSCFDEGQVVCASGCTSRERRISGKNGRPSNVPPAGGRTAG